MTEDEAKTKLCPASMSLPACQGQHNSGPHCCIGSACMAFRTATEHSTVYCGLAGRP